MDGMSPKDLPDLGFSHPRKRIKNPSSIFPVPRQKTGSLRVQNQTLSQKWSDSILFFLSLLNG